MTAAELLDLAATPGAITEKGLRTDVNVGFQYISFWLPAAAPPRSTR